MHNFLVAVAPDSNHDDEEQEPMPNLPKGPLTCLPIELDPDAGDNFRIGADDNDDGESTDDVGGKNGREKDGESTKVIRKYLYHVQDQLRYEVLSLEDQQKEDGERVLMGKEPRQKWLLEYLKQHSFWIRADFFRNLL